MSGWRKPFLIFSEYRHIIIVRNDQSAATAVVFGYNGRIFRKFTEHAFDNLVDFCIFGDSQLVFRFRILAVIACAGDNIDHIVSALIKAGVIINGLDEFSAQLRRIGNNVNQLARAVNAGYASQINLTETKKELGKIWQSLNSLLQDAR